MSDSELLQLIGELNRRKKENVAESYGPGKKFEFWPKQQMFLDSQADIKAFIAGNRCLAGEQEIYDPLAGKSLRVDSIEGDFHVLAWDGSSQIVAKASRPFLKGVDDIYRIECSDGSILLASGAHLVLTPSGWLPVSCIHSESSLTRLPSTLDSDQLARVEDVSRSIQRALDSQSDYSACSYPCGGPLRNPEEDAQGGSPSQIDALQHKSESFQGSSVQDDAQACRAEHSHPYRSLFHHSNPGGLDLISVPFCLHEGQDCNTVHLPVWDSPEALLRFHRTKVRDQQAPECAGEERQVPHSSCDLRSSCVLPVSNSQDNGHQLHGPESQVEPQHQILSFQDPAEVSLALQGQQGIVSQGIRCVSSAFVASNAISIVRIDYLRQDEVWDFEVEDCENYFIGNILNHNCGKTQTACYEVMCHLTGQYPDWWKGFRFSGPITAWVAGVTWIRLRDTVQVKLLGGLGRMGTGMIPKECLGEPIKKAGIPYAVDQVPVKHVSGEWSTLQFFSFEMSREQFQGSSVSLILFDEEPPEDIYNECKMRILDCNGNMMFTFTPLSGVTPLYDSIMRSDNIFKVHMSMDEASHLDQVAIEKLLDGMDEFEKRARRDGVASVGSGKVFGFAEDEYTIEPFDIPAHWPRLGALDVGLTHPTGALCVVKDPDSGVLYVINEYRVSNKTPIDHAAHLKHWGVPFVTDPAAFIRQIGTMTSVASMYEDEGLEVIRADNDVKKSIMEIRRLIGSGCLFIFSTLEMLLKEIRTYRTNESGNIIKKDDDLIDPLRYAVLGIEEHGVVMKRHKTFADVKRFRPADAKVGY